MRLPQLSPNLIKQSQLTKRLQAWWEGYYYQARDEAEPAPEEAPDEVALAPTGNGRQAATWSDPRLRGVDSRNRRAYVPRAIDFARRKPEP